MIIVLGISTIKHISIPLLPATSLRFILGERITKDSLNAMLKGRRGIWDINVKLRRAEI